MTNEKSSTGDHGHLRFLLVALVAAIIIWYLWLTWGMYWAQNKVLEQLKTAQLMVAPPNQDEATIRDPSTTAASSERERLFAELGQTGDSFGALNALLTAMAGALVFWAGMMQHQSLKQARQEAKDERAHRQLQEFESLFFQLLDLSTTVTERIERTVRPRGSAKEDPDRALRRRIGSRALDSFAQMIYSSVSESPPNESSKAALQKLLREFAERIYGRSPSTFGPYFRLLYQTFKHVAESSLLEHEQIRYANIARGQISEGAVLLLALNGLSEYGYKFIPLIEKFGLLEHLHPRYRQRYEEILRVGYRARAFMGSADRAKPNNKWIDKPLLPENHFGG